MGYSLVFMDKNTYSKKKMLNILYSVIGVYVAVMYLLCAFRDDARSYSIMANLSLSFGILSGIFFVEGDKSRCWFAPIFVGALWVTGIVIDFVLSLKTSTWNKYHVIVNLHLLLCFFLPALVFWALSRIKKGRNVIQAFVGALFALLSLGFLPGRGKLEPIYDILLVVMAMTAFAMVTLHLNRRQRWISLLVFLAVYSYTVIANPFVNLVMFVLVAVALFLVLGILSAAWESKTKRTAFAASACLLSALAVFAIPMWGNYALQRFVYPEFAIPIKEQVKFESAFVTPENDTLTLETLHGKTVVLYFWSASCGTCHAMMPDYSTLAESYSDAPDKVFFAVFMGEKENELKHYEEMTNREYAFRWAMALDAKDVMEKMSFNAFPHLTIVSPDGTLVYNGIISFDRMNVYHPRRYLGRER